MTRTVFVVGGDPSVRIMFHSNAWRSVDDPQLADFICFTGGADVSPHLYGEKNEGLSHCDPKRDDREVAIYHAFFEKPKIGICRGGQFLNVMSGGKMKQHHPGHMMGQQRVRTIGPHSKFFTAHEDHHQVILPTTEGFVFLRAVVDDVVEGVYYPHTKSFCFQPHPEWGHKETKDLFFSFLNLYND